MTSNLLSEGEPTPENIANDILYNGNIVLKSLTSILEHRM